MVPMLIMDKDGVTIASYMLAEEPTLGIYYEEEDLHSSKVVVGNNCWIVQTAHLSKGESYVGKINRSL